MSWLRKKAKQVAVGELYDMYANVLEAGPRSSGTVHHLGEIPPKKELIKAIVLSKPYEFGSRANEPLAAGFASGFASLAHFETETSEPAGSPFHIAAEMTNLMSEWSDRATYPVDKSNA